MFLQNAGRSARTVSPAPAALEPLWRAQAASPGEGPIATMWRARLTACAGAPTAAGDRVLVPATDAGQVVAFDAATGKEAWRFTAGGRVDTPPTFLGALCVFGSHDGWIYALRASDGVLAWRTRLAPWERRMVAFGGVESVWPAAGSVAASGGVVFATAGRSTEADGGLAVAALDPATGRAKWSRAVGPDLKVKRQNDLLTLADGKLRMRHAALDPATGEASTGPEDTRAGLENMADGTWRQIGTRRSGQLVHGRAVGEMLAWNDDTLFGYRQQDRTCFAVPLAKCSALPTTAPLAQSDYTWRVQVPPVEQAEAFALCGDALVIAGRSTEAMGAGAAGRPEDASGGAGRPDETGAAAAKATEAATAKPTGFVRVLGLADGKPRAERALDAPPAYQSLAVARGRVYVTQEDGAVVCLGAK